MRGTPALSIVTVVFLFANVILTFRRAYTEWNMISQQIRGATVTRQLFLWKWMLIWFALSVGFLVLILVKIAHHFEAIKLSTSFLILWGLFIAINVFVHLCDVYKHRHDARRAYFFGVIAVCFFAIFILTVIASAL